METMNDYAAAPYLLVNDLFPLSVGAVLLILSVVRIRKEARRYSNAVFLAAAVFFLTRGLIRFYINNNWHMVQTAEGFYYTDESVVLNVLTIIFLASFFAIGAWMIFMGIRLVRKEGWTKTHALSIFFGLMSLSMPFIIFSLMESGVYGGIPPYLSFFILGGFYVPFCCFAYFLYSFLYRHLPKKRKPDYVMVLGASLSGKRVSPLLARRADKAIEVWKKNGEEPVLIPSGGQGRDEEVSEASAIHAYLKEQVVPEDRILEENQSVNTWQNMQFSKKLMDERSGGKDYYAIFSTNDFHVYRSAVYARAAGLPADGVGCRTADYYYPSAILREVMAFILRYRKLAVLYMSAAAVYTVTDIISHDLVTYLW
jgi:uncharacterized SAM-binding protein YcdF (DUF218 family)